MIIVISRFGKKRFPWPVSIICEKKGISQWQVILGTGSVMQ